MPGRNGASNKKGNPPVSKATNRSIIRSSGIRRESGVERLETVLHRDNEPRELSLSWIDAFRRLNRLASVASMYEKYRFTKLRLHYKPSVGTQSNGSLHVAYEMDPLDFLSDVQPGQLPSVLSQHPVSYITPVWQPSFLDVDYRDPGETKFPWMWVDPVQNPRLCSLGKIYYYSDNTSFDTNSILGYFEIEYTVEFCRPTASPVRIFGQAVTTERGNEAQLYGHDTLSDIRLDSPVVLGDETPRFLESDGTTIEKFLDSSSLYTALLGAGAHFLYSGDVGGALMEGTRIYFRSPSYQFVPSTSDDTDDLHNDSVYSKMGNASTRPDMLVPLTWTGRSASDSTRFLEIERITGNSHGHDEL